ncbi:MAG: 16S rRNA (cytidine(1402)-2'-O)-methyltransferase [Rhodospirillaceae bacterium]|nr:16S rRNA (cytidine(1402)-2'-O)-methyltransferase [Rhodospirillaceae bacterium]
MTELGQLFVVATPIGNMGDITQRAVSVFQSVDYIAAEDTRVTKEILKRFSIHTPIKSYHDFSNEKDRELILLDLLQGKSLALVCDAGTPLISDPGYKLVRLAKAKNISVKPVPGACSVIAALSVSGLPTDRFQFDGFIPAKTLARKIYFESILFEKRSVVLFESKHRILESFIALSEVLQSDREVFIAREITKKFESDFKGTAKQCLDWLRSDNDHTRGEFVLVIKGCGDFALSEKRKHEAMKIMDSLEGKLSVRDAIRVTSEISGIQKNVLYDKVIEVKN